MAPPAASAAAATKTGTNAAAGTTGGAAATNTSHKVWAIRKCDSLQAPALFTSWLDFNFYLEASEDDGSAVEYESFDNLLDAMSYIMPATSLETRVATTARAKQISVGTPIRAATTTAAATGRAPSLTAPVVPTPVPVAAQTTVRVVKTNTNGIASTTTTTICPRPVKRGRPPKDPTPPTNAAGAETPSSSSPSKKRKTNNKEPKRVPWETRFEQLRAYKMKNGHCRVSRELFKTDRPFYQWMLYEQCRIERVLKLRQQLLEQQQQDTTTGAPEKDITITAQDTERVDRLLALGMTVPPDKRAALEGADTGKRREVKWEARFEQLKAFKEEHGTLTIPTETNDQLRRWVKYQSRQLAAYENDPEFKGQLNESQRNRLLELGLEPDEPKARTSTPGFDEMYAQLVKFHETHGNADVPNKPSEPVENWTKELRNWCIHVRENYVKFKKGEPVSDKSTAKLNPERIRDLIKLDFNFEIVRRLNFDYRAAEWFEYFTKHGRDPKRDDEEYGYLAAWASKIRREYWAKQRDKNHKGPMSQARTDKLKAWGFDFREPVKMNTTGERKSWEERFQELLEYKEQHGTVDVPQQLQGLGTWVHHQRRHYRHLKRGKKSTLNKDRIERLVKIGFKWITRKPPTRPGDKQEGFDFARYEINQPDGAVTAGGLGGSPAVGRPKDDDDNDEESSSDEDDDDNDNDEDSSTGDYRFDSSKPSPRGKRASNMYRQPVTQPLPTQQQHQYATLPPAQHQYGTDQQWGRGWNGGGGRFV